MERQQEIGKLINVLRQTARTAQQAAWTGGNAEAAAFSIDQYNRVLGRLKALDPGLGSLYEPLAPGSSLTVVAMACRQLAAYYADEVGAAKNWPGGPGVPFDPESMKDFWRKSAGEIEDFGEFIRENLDAWLCRTRPRTRTEPPKDAPKDTPTGGV